MVWLRREHTARRRLLYYSGIALLVLLVYGLIFFSLLTPGDRDQPPLALSGHTRLDPPRPLPDFTLTNQDGRPFSLSDLRGRPALLFFGYTFCPDICPTTLAEFTQVHDMLGADAGRVAFVFVSVDGSRDTPDLLKRYLAMFRADIIGLTGPEEQVRQIGAEYGVFFERSRVEGSSAAYLVDHSAASYLLDAEGRLQSVFAYGTEPELIQHELLLLLQKP